jgi:hypothetical protein
MEPFAGLHEPPPVPGLLLQRQAMMHDPYISLRDVAARTGPGLLWWGKTAPVCHPRVSVAVSVLSFVQSAAKPQCVRSPVLSWEHRLCASCVPL